MAELKTQARQESVAAFIAAIDHPGRRVDAAALVGLMARLTGAPATLWGSSIIGFGRYRYRTAAGQTCEMCRLGFSPRKANLVLYVLTGFDGQAALLGRLGKHRTGTSCLYVTRLADVDGAVLEEIVRRAWRWMADHHPD